MIGIKDFKERFDKAKDLMNQRDISSIFLTPSADMYYLTGVWTSPLERLFLCVIPLDEDPLFIVPKLYEEQVKKTSWIENVRVWSDNLKATTQMRKIIQELQIQKQKIAITDNILMKHFKIFQKSVSNAEFIYTSEFLSQIRMCKSKNEIKHMENASKFAEDALESIILECKDGKKEFELAALAEFEMRKRGSEGPSFETIVASGSNSSFPHHLTGKRVIHNGDPIIFDLGAKCGYYCSDITRTVCIGKVSSKIEKIYNLIYRAYQEAISNVRPGISAGFIDKTARRISIEGGYGDYFIHRTGHGIGIDI
ncbi:MAG: aminopeptidase P family protein, partial [Asgard group archaeon]|nr:aminopeptidase P family protein [Asgard group archaeon]